MKESRRKLSSCHDKASRQRSTCMYTIVYNDIMNYMVFYVSTWGEYHQLSLLFVVHDWGLKPGAGCCWSLLNVVNLLFWPFVAVVFVKGEFERRQFASNGFPYHVNGVVGLRRMLVREVKIHLLQSVVHPDPFIALHASQQVDDEAALESVFRLHEQTELRVV